MPIEKTVVGSFPKLNSPIPEAIKEIVELQLNYGIDLITDGEQQNNMIQYFEQIPGLQKHEDGLKITGKIKPIPQNNIDEFHKIKDYQTTKNILQNKNKQQTKIKTEITGPMTLGTACASKDIHSTMAHYNLIENQETFYTDISKALLPIAKRLLDLGAHIQIDEPLLSTGQITIETAKKILTEFTSQLPTSAIKEEKISIHVCGSIKSVPNLYQTLLELNIPILSIGFSGEEEKENLNIISKTTLKDHNKKLSAGFISNINVEDQKTAIARYKTIEQKTGKEQIKYLQPDCGFRMTPLKKVKQILETMKNATEQI